MSIKLRSANEPIPYICTFDSAVDLAKANLDKYRDTLDRKYLPLLDGGQPSVFYLKKLTGPQIQHVRSRQSMSVGGQVVGAHEGFAEAIAYGIDRVENFPFTKLEKKQSEIGMRLTPESLEPFLLTSQLLYELGGVIQRIGGLDPLDEKL